MKSQRKDERLYNRGTLAMMDGRLDEAIKLLQRVARNSRDASLQAQAWGNLGVAFRRSDRLADARDAFESALAIDPQDNGARLNLANTLRDLGEHESALAAYKVVHEASASELETRTRNHPNDAAAHHELAGTLLDLGHLDSAETAAQKAVQLDPAFAQAWSTLATIQAQRGLAGVPLRSILQATRLEPDNLHFRQRMGTLLLDQGHTEAAIRTFRAVLQAKPDDLDSIAGLATGLERAGELDDAKALMQPIIDTGVVHARLGATWATVCRRRGEPELGIPVLNHMLEAPLNPKQRTKLLNVLGAIQDKIGDCDAAFSSYTRANQLCRGRFDPDALIAQTDAIIETFSADALSQFSRSTQRTDLPVFIVGMPRSGTSLVEQILSSHPEVYGGGELNDLRVTTHLESRGIQADYPKHVSNLGPQDMAGIGKWYLDRRQQQAPDSARVTDKMPQNFQHLGWASLILPGARVIHCKRDLLDTALSCYFQSFRDALSWSNRLDWLGCFILQYQRLMDHWLDVCPLPIHTVDYQQLVTDPEPHIRELIAFCDLEWDDAVMSHHTSSRPINTASYAQATRPIYRSSAGRSLRYATHLLPLQRILDGK